MYHKNIFMCLSVFSEYEQKLTEMSPDMLFISRFRVLMKIIQHSDMFMSFEGHI